MKRTANEMKDNKVASNVSVEFVPSSVWQGPMQGFYFGTRNAQTGYYRDKNGAQEQHLSDSQSKRSFISNASQDESVTKRPRRTVHIDEDLNQVKIINQHHQNDESKNTDASAETLLEQAEQEAANSNHKPALLLDLSPRGLGSAATALTRVLQTNELQHAAYDAPEKYLESEVMLYEHIVALKAVASGDVEVLYPCLYTKKLEDANDSTSILSTLAQLLQHENTDIIASVVSVLLEWLDVSLLVLPPSNRKIESENHVQKPAVAELASQVLQQGILEHLIANLFRLQQSDATNIYSGKVESNDDVGKGAEDVLTLVENLLEMELQLQQLAVSVSSKSLGTFKLLPDGSLSAFLCRMTNLVAWLFEQLQIALEQTPSITAIQDRSLELLAGLAAREDVYTELPDWSRIPIRKSTFIENDEDVNENNTNFLNKKNEFNTSKQSTIDGIDIILQIVAIFRKKQPDNADQVEFLENACLVMDSLLTFRAANVRAFLDHQGIELVMRCLKEHVHAGGTALRWLDFTGEDLIYQRACEYMVSKAGALKHLFPIFMNCNSQKVATAVAVNGGLTKKAQKEWIKNALETTIRILYSLTRHLQDDSPHDVKQRLLAKFVSNFDKCDRLVELVLVYEQKARLAEYKFFRSEVEDAILSEDNSDRNNGSREDLVRLAALDAKLTGGGDIFHRLCAIAAFCCVGSKHGHERILSQLHLQKSGVSLIKEGLQDFISILDNGNQKEQLVGYLEQI